MIFANSALNSAYFAVKKNIINRKGRKGYAKVAKEAGNMIFANSALNSAYFTVKKKHH